MTPTADDRGGVFGEPTRKGGFLLLEPLAQEPPSERKDQTSPLSGEPLEVTPQQPSKPSHRDRRLRPGRRRSGETEDTFISDFA